jgi:hypothetical protein
LYIDNPPPNISFVFLNRIKPELPEEYLTGAKFDPHGPAIEMAFLNEKKEQVDPWSSPSSVLFNIGEKEMELWEEGGSDSISIRYYNKTKRIWTDCPTRFIRQDASQRFDRLACFVQGNGIYILGTPPASEYFLAEGPKTITFGKQGLFIENPPSNVTYVQIRKIEPPFPLKLFLKAEYSFRGPMLDLTFRNANKAMVNPGATLTSVYFNISEPELKLWEAGGPDEIAIWYYNKSSDSWQMCHTRYIPEKQNNDLYDRLACRIIGNGFYALGKMAFDPFFPLWFRLQGRELDRHRPFFQDY